jgi:aminoglycoside phosphotransferase (APT) family kinase protein
VRHLDFEAWLAPVAWLGRMYGHFVARPEPWRDCDVLARHDAPFFEATAEQALRSVTEFSPALGRRFEPIVSRYHRAVAVMTSQPQTLVHGTYRPAQIITDDPQHPRRVCPVDWEKAAVGASLYDLTFIVDGFEGERLHRLFEAYRDEARRCGAPAGDDAEMKAVVDCFRLHRVMNWLAVSLARRYEARVIHKLIGMAEDVGALVL